MTKEKGFSMITAIFLVVLISALGISMLFMSSTQSQSSNIDLESSRAYQASKAGIEWGLYQIETPVSAPACFANYNLNLTGELNKFTTTVQCSQTSYNDGSDTIQMYTITSNSCNKPVASSCPGTSTSINYVERQLKVVLYR